MNDVLFFVVVHCAVSFLFYSTSLLLSLLLFLFGILIIFVFVISLFPLLPLLCVHGNITYIGEATITHNDGKKYICMICVEVS